MQKPYLFRSSSVLRRGAAVVLTATLLLGCCVLPARAASSGTCAKEEVVYANLSAAGAVEGIYVVNQFQLSGGGTIVDYGSYSAVRNMTTTDTLDFDGQTVRTDTQSDSLYYEGTLNDAALPWLFSVGYQLDGTELAPEALAGQSGQLKISLSVRQNPDCNPVFFEHYALQISLSLDRNLCENIQAEGATQADVGRQRQLSYTVLPGQEADYTITAQVEQFALDGISFNGVPMTLDLELDGLVADNGELTDAAAALSDAAGGIADGAGQLAQGIQSARAGAEELGDGLSALSGSGAELNSGAYTVFSGLTAMAQQQLNTALAEAGMDAVTLTPENYSGVLSQLLEQVAGSAYTEARTQVSEAVTAAVRTQVSQLAVQAAEAQITETITQAVQSEAASQVRSALIAQLTADGFSLQEAEDYLLTEAGQTRLEEAVRQQMTSDAVQNQIAGQTAQQMASDTVQAQIAAVTEEQMSSQEVQAEIAAQIAAQMASSELQDRIAAAAASSDAYRQITSLKASLDAYQSFYTGLGRYTAGVNAAAAGSTSLAEGLRELTDGADALSSGAGEFADTLSGLDSVLTDRITEEISSALDWSFDPVSFVDSRNTDTQFVQFVIQTPAIAVEDADTAEEESPVELSWWQKLLQLFGLYGG